MALNTCSACNGRGGYHATERVPNPAGGMFMEMQVWKNCLMCGGSGSVWVPDSAPGAITLYKGKKSKRPPRRTPATPEESDRSFAVLLTLVFAGFMIHAMFGRDLQAELWVKWTIIGASIAVCRRVLHKAKRLTRFLRYATVYGLAAFLIAFLVKAALDS